MSNAPPSPHACCPFCTDTPTWRRPSAGRTPRAVECPRCRARFVPFPAGSEILRPPTEAPAAA